MKLQFNAILIASLVGILLISCELFETREPQPPSTNQSSFRPPDTDEIVFENFKNAIAEANTDNYIRCFADGQTTEKKFEFIASTEWNLTFSGIFSNWTLENERQYFHNMGKPTPGQNSPKLFISNKNRYQSLPDTVIYQFDYKFYFPHQRIGIIDTVSGNMLLYITSKPTPKCFIFRWIDNKTTSDFTWSYWKAIFSNQ